MTRIVDTKVLERCVDSVASVEILLDSPIDEGLMRRLGAGSSLAFYPDFPRPLFKIDAPGAYYIVGLLGSRSLRVTCLEPLLKVTETLRARVEEAAGAESAVPEGDVP